MALVDGGGNAGGVALPVPMFKLLAEREEGQLRPLALERFTRAARAELLGLSHNREIEPFSDSVVSCMKIDEVEDRYLLAGHRDGSLSIIDVEDAPQRKHQQFQRVLGIGRGVHQFAVTGCAWYPIDTGMFVTSSFDKTVRVWDTNRAKDVHKFTLAEKVFCIDMLSSTSRHSLVAAGCGDDRVYLCDLRTGSHHHALRGHQGGGG